MLFEIGDTAQRGKAETKTSNIQHRTPNIQCSRLNRFGCWMLDVGCWMFDTKNRHHLRRLGQILIDWKSAPHETDTRVLSARAPPGFPAVAGNARLRCLCCRIPCE